MLYNCTLVWCSDLLWCYIVWPFCDLVIFYDTLYEPLVTLLQVFISPVNTHVRFIEEPVFFWPCHFCCCIVTRYNTYMTLLWPCYFCCYIVWTMCDLVIFAANIIWPFFCSLVYDLLWPYCYCYSLFDLFVSLLFLLLILWPLNFVISAAYYLTLLFLLLIAWPLLTFQSESTLHEWPSDIQMYITLTRCSNFPIV